EDLLALLEDQLLVGPAPIPVNEPVREAHAGDFGDLVAVGDLEDDRIEFQPAVAGQILQLADDRLILADHGPVPRLPPRGAGVAPGGLRVDRKSTRLNSSHVA